MITIKQIKAPISDEIAQFNKEFISNIKTEIPFFERDLEISSPIPPEAPVITALFPLKLSFIYCFFLK